MSNYDVIVQTEVSLQNFRPVSKDQISCGLCCSHCYPFGLLLRAVWTVAVTYITHAYCLRPAYIISVCIQSFIQLSNRLH